MTNVRDDIYSLPMNQVGSFAFDEQVVRVFPDMIARSVPGYGSILSMIEQLAARFIRPTTSVWDLGCSLGAATRLIRKQAPADSVIHAVDNSPAMISRLKAILSEANERGCEIVFHEQDLRETVIANASFVVLNLTLQFLPPQDRSSVIQKVYQGLLPGGALLLSEKICFDDPAQQDLLTQLHHDFKRAHGYSDLEIAQKRTSIENRLIPESLQTHVQRLRDAGFETIVPWFQCFNFVSILAVRSANGSDTMCENIFKICSRSVWEEIRLCEFWTGSAHDLRDGFIHFSTASQVSETIRKHYADQDNLMLLKVDAASLGDGLKWEPSRGGQLFPHLYGPLPLSSVIDASPLV